MARGGNDLDWRQVTASFNDANSSMGNAINAYSQAGNIFSKLRESVLTERQRQADNAYRQQVFEENARQFGVTSGETGRHNLATEQHATDTLGLEREKQLFDVAKQIAEETGGFISNYMDGSTPNLSAPQSTSGNPLDSYPKDWVDAMVKQGVDPNQKIQEVQGYANFAKQVSSGAMTNGANSILNGQYGSMVRDTANRYGIPLGVFAGMIGQESGGNPNAKSPTGVVGLGQVTTPVMKQYGYTAADRTDPVKSADAAARYLSDLQKQYGNWEDALIAYNGGDGAVKGYRASQQNQSNMSGLSLPGQERMLKMREQEVKIREAEQTGKDRTALQEASRYTSLAAKGFDTQLKDIDRQIQDIQAIAGTTEGDALAGKLNELQAAREQIGRESLKASTESGRELLTLQYLEELGMGHLTADRRAKRAELEMSHAREIDKEKLRANASWSKTLQDNNLTENKTALQTAKILSGIEDGVIFGKYATEAQTALQIARNAKIPESKILEAFSTFSTKDDNWFFDTPMQDAIQKFNKDQSGPFAEALGFYSNPSNAGKEFKSGESNGNTRQGPFNSVLEKRYGGKTLQDLRASGLTDSDISRLDQLAMLTAKGNQGIFKETSNNLAQNLGMDFIARKVFDSNVYSDPEPSPQDFQSALAIVQRQRQEANQRNAQRQADLKSRQQQFEQSIKK